MVGIESEREGGGGVGRVVVVHNGGVCVPDRAGDMGKQRYRPTGRICSSCQAVRLLPRCAPKQGFGCYDCDRSPCIRLARPAYARSDLRACMGNTTPSLPPQPIHPTLANQ